MAKRHKCLHPVCQCILSEDEEYCSEDCENAGEDEPICECEHAECHLSGLKQEHINIPSR